MTADIACVRGILGVDADDLTDDELRAVIKDLERRARERQRINEGMDAAEALNLEAAGVAADMELAAKIEKRNAALSILRHKEARSYVDGFADKAQGLEALLAGSNVRREGARVSVETRSRAREGEYLGGLVSELKREGLLDFVQAKFLGSGKGPLDDKIAVELYELRDGGSPGSSGSKEARQIAAIIHKYQELARADQNRAGAFIKKLPGYIVAQSHDMFRIRRAGKDEWIAKTLPLLDAERTFDGRDPIAFLSAVYDELSSGQFYKADADAPLIGFKGPANLAKKVSQSRVLHFRDAQGWIAYNDAFGQGGIMEAVTFGLRRAARNVALMDTLGPNPRAMFDRLRAEYAQEAIGDNAGADNLRKANFRLTGMMNVADGSTSIPGSVTMAGIGQGYRTWQAMAKLGGAVISSLPDVATAAGELQYQGRGFLSGMAAQLNAFFGSIKSNSVRRQVAERLGAGIDGMLGRIVARVDAADNLPGRMAKLQTRFFQLNLLSWWTDAHESGLASIMANDLGLLGKVAHGALPERTKAVMGLHGIGEREWEIIRRHGIEAAEDGRLYAFPDLVREAPDEAFAGMVEGKVTKAKIAAARDQVATKLQAYYLDRTSFGVVKGGIRERFAATQGQQAGTPLGEAARFLMLFRTYSISFANKVFGRYAQADAFWKVPGALARMPWGDKRQAAQMVLAMTALGYVSLSAKAILKGQEPPDPADTGTWGKAALQGGGMGIYGDFLAADFNRFGGGAVETIGGPAAGTLGDAARLYGATRDWVAGVKDKSPEGQVFNIFKNNTPFINLFYTRAALDYLLLYDVQEAIAPGSLKRMERRLKEERGQRFLLPPSTSRAQPITAN